MNPPETRGRPGIAWAAILLTATVIITMHALPAAQPENAGSMDLILLEMQAKYIVGTRRLMGADDRILAQTAALNSGSVTQRQCYIALLSELGGPREAAVALAELKDLIRAERASSPDAFELTPAEERTQRVLSDLFPVEEDPPAADGGNGHPARVEALSGADRDALIRELGWFGRLVLVPEGATGSGRESLLAEAWRITLVIMGVFGTLFALGLAGLVGLIALAVLAARGKVQSGFGASTTPHGIYAETFAVWLVSFVLLQLLAGLLAVLVPGGAMAITALVFLASLLALAWPRLRGVSFDRVRADIGWIAGRQPWLEPLVGIGGYFLALPMLAVGILCTLLLIVIDGALSGGASTFTSNAPPAHPIVNELANSTWGLRLLVLFLAAVVAPIVEETMFRGVLYRHLRGATAGLGLLLSVLVSGLFNGLLFAAIHPQGWVAIPALMSLAFAFVLLREWRGTLVPAMIVHGISNGLVMLLLFAILGG